MTTLHATALDYTELVREINDFLAPSVCRDIIKAANDKGFNDSSVSGGGHGRTGEEDPRTSQFCVLGMNDLAADLYSLAHDNKGAEWVPYGVCERMRIYKYQEGDSFPEHIDYKMRRKVIERDGASGKLVECVDQSFITLLVYLNEDFEGDQTGYWPDHQGIHCRFLRKAEKQMEKKNHQVLITPQAGTAVLQYQNVLHEGLPPTSGTKYVLRTDIIHRSRKTSRHAKLPPLETEHRNGEFVGEWERLFETSCKNYAD